MTKYEFIKDVTQQLDVLSLVKVGLFSYIVPRHVEIYEDLERLSKDLPKEEAVKIVCQKYKMNRSKVFKIQSEMRSDV